MRIPSVTTKPRFYVATSRKEAYSSWDTLEDARACVLRFEEHDPKGAARIIGIIETSGHVEFVLHPNAIERGDHRCEVIDETR